MNRSFAQPSTPVLTLLATALLFAGAGCIDNSIATGTQGAGASNANANAAVGPGTTFLAAGQHGQDCYIDSTCDAGHVCRGFCLEQQTQPGVLGGTCSGTSACSAGLSCNKGVCVDPSALRDYYASLALVGEPSMTLRTADRELATRMFPLDPEMMGSLLLHVLGAAGRPRRAVEPSVSL